jgi:uridine kinase
MAEAVRELGSRLRAAPPRAGRTRVLAIDGRSGSGKSTLARLLATSLQAQLVSMEYLYGSWDGLEHGIDLLISEVLEPLAAGRPARVPRFDWERGVWDEPVTLAVPDLLIVEGVGAGARRAAEYESVVVWLEMVTPIRKQRAISRDGAGYAANWDRWANQEQIMLAREATPDRADVVLRICGG